MPLEWISLAAATAAKAAVSALAKAATKDAYSAARDRASRTLGGDDPLRRLFEDAWAASAAAFLGVLESFCHLEAGGREQLEHWVRDADGPFARALSELAWRRPDEVDLADCRAEAVRLFHGQGLSEKVFDNAWNILSERFYIAVSQSEALDRFVGLQRQEAQARRDEGSNEHLAAFRERLVDETVAPEVLVRDWLGHLARECDAMPLAVIDAS